MNTRNKARATELEILHQLSRFGYLSVEQVGRLAYPGSSKASATRMSNRVLHRLSIAGEVLLRNGTGPVPSYAAIALPGVHRLERESGAEGLVSGKDLLRQISVHRCACNDVAIRARGRHPGAFVYPERMIQTNRSPLKRLEWKIPDVVVMSGTLMREVHWIEVEAGIRKTNSHSRLAGWLVRVCFTPTKPEGITFSGIGCELYLRKVEFVLMPGEKLRRLFHKRFRDAMTQALALSWNRGEPVTDAWLDDWLTGRVLITEWQP